MVEHNVNPQTDKCVRCGRNSFNRKHRPECLTTGDYVEKWSKEASMNESIQDYKAAGYEVAIEELLEAARHLVRWQREHGGPAN